LQWSRAIAKAGEIEELDPGNTIPWQSWFLPLLTWGVFLLACWLLMVGVGLVLLPEWRDHERLPFPLLGVLRRICDPPLHPARAKSTPRLSKSPRARMTSTRLPTV